MKAVLLSISTLFLAMAASAQSAPKPTERDLQVAFDRHLKDAPSARFRDVQLVREGESGVWVMCGYVNAKNAMGAYAGYSRFIGAAVREGKSTKYVVMELGEVADQTCSGRGL